MPDFEFKKTSIEGLMEITPRYFPDHKLTDIGSVIQL